MAIAEDDVYNFGYALTGTIGGSMQVESITSTMFGVYDDQDGSTDQSTAVGQGFSIAFPGNGFPLLGLSAGGDPIVDDLGSQYLLSNAVLNVGDTFETTASGTYTYCFTAGTMIATLGGECVVEALSTGDIVITDDGRCDSVKWIGRQTVFTRFQPADRLMPVRFAAGSLGDGLPHSDLTVTADHAMLVAGILCHAAALVNGTTITRVPLSEMGERFTVYHVETEAHEIILANGAPAETFIDNGSRRAFDNFAEFEAMYGDVPEMTELPYPRAMSARQVPQRVKTLLASPAHNIQILARTA